MGNKVSVIGVNFKNQYNEAMSQVVATGTITPLLNLYLKYNKQLEQNHGLSINEFLGLSNEKIDSIISVEKYLNDNKVNAGSDIIYTESLNQNDNGSSFNVNYIYPIAGVLLLSVGVVLIFKK